LINYDKENSVAIVYGTIYWVPTNSGNPITFTDSFNQPLFSTIDSFSVPNYAPIPQVKKGSKVNITCSLAGIIFSINYQYLIESN
jgi:hypothetical protein